ncbi:hypothetical protein DAPPUDRAFT_242441 [Daphnia pulex]|uniref:Uncharacterized protein n=1 Tax=Daphnia pulex TaxID=6669 RepID=E9GGN8_DAPPU|nr:hypothetical protein DAPPUDRAFT_242441 [Daphnia pulex]|eukprot:EFX81455.1 hypothetical protein DAPPUDRAFT_242441 [Daphnia pulex]
MSANQKPRKKIQTVSEVSEEKRPRVEQGIALILIVSATPDAIVPVIIEESPVTTKYQRQLTNHNFYSIVGARGKRGKVIDKT